MNRGKGGFTLIEILVATTILLVIVIIASLVFQQTTGAYDTGERKVNANVILRNVVGAITRDMALAVDSDDYPGLSANQWDASGVRFVALTGRPGSDAAGVENEETKTCRTPHVITYDSTGTRTDVATSCTGGRWSTQGQRVTASLYDSSSSGVTDFSVSFHPVFDAGNGSTLPDCVYVRAELETEGETSVVGAGSGGSRGWGSGDEIWVGIKP